MNGVKLSHEDATTKRRDNKVTIVGDKESIRAPYDGGNH